MILNSRYFINFTKKLLPLLCATAMITLPIALYQSIISSPEDYQQGEYVRIMYVHVPAAWCALGVYSFIAGLSFINIIWRIPLCYILSMAFAPIGCSFTLITLITGSIWGKPTWGTWWVWDARLTSMLILFITYLTYILVVNAGNIIMKAQKPAAVIAILGFINVPIVKFSVNLWNSLHQPASVLRLGAPTIDPSMLIPLGLMTLSYILYATIFGIIRSYTLISKIKKHDLRCY